MTILDFRLYEDFIGTLGKTIIGVTHCRHQKYSTSYIIMHLNDGYLIIVQEDHEPHYILDSDQYKDAPSEVRKIIEGKIQ